MKRTNIYKSLILSALVFSTFSCKKTLDVNVDPNNPSIDNATPEVLFPTATMSTAGAIGGELAVLGGFWSQYWTQSFASNQYKTIDSYNLTNKDLNRPYQELFSGALGDYNLAIKKAQERSDWRYNLMATTLKAYTFQVLVDLYDQVPYTEAFQGAANIQPKFDDGYSIYVALLAELDAALAKDFLSAPLDATQEKTDFLFGGDLTKWEQFANTLKLKMYLRMVNTKPSEAQTGIAKLYADGANFLTETAGIPAFEDVPDNSNPMYEFNVRRQNTITNIRASMTLVSYLKAHNDPRTVSYFNAASPIAMHQGDYTATQAQQPTYATATVAYQKPTDPVPFLSAAESYFMQAEALERYSGGAGAKEMYDAGVTAAFDQAGLDGSDFIEAGGTYAYPAGSPFEGKLEAIITQKWLSFPGSHALEGFFEQERTGYPKTSAVYSTDPSYIAGQWVYARNGVTSGKFPKRLVFPSVSRERNNNTPAEVPITTKVWWGK